MAIQYNQFSSFARAASQVANRLNHVVSESSSGQAAFVSAASRCALRNVSAIHSSATPRCQPNGQTPTASSSSLLDFDQLTQPYSDMPTKNTCSADCIGSSRNPAASAAAAELTAPETQHRR